MLEAPTTKVVAVRTHSLVAVWMRGLLPEAPIRMDVDVRLLNMVAVQMVKQKLKERNLKDVRRCQSCLERHADKIKIEAPVEISK